MYDLIIIGGGILGLSTAWQWQQQRPDDRVLVIEKEPQLGGHQTGHNSGVIHAGVYYTPGSLKARYCLEGSQRMLDFCQQQQIAHQQCGKLLVATCEIERQRMSALWHRSADNGLERYWLDADELRQREANIQGVGAIWVPASGIVNYQQVAAKLAELFCASGGELVTEQQLVALAETPGQMLVETDTRQYRSRYLVSCAGLQADRVIAMLGLEPGFRICPFRGEYYRLASKHNDIVKHLIYPIPDPSLPFLGVHLTRMIDGSVTVGPNAVLAWGREAYLRGQFNWRDSYSALSYPGVRKLLAKNWRHGLSEAMDSWFKGRYLEQVRKYCPSLELADLEPYPSGVRAQAVKPDGSMVDDFLFVETARSLHVGNAPSPAATSSLPIGEHIVTQLLQKLNS